MDNLVIVDVGANVGDLSKHLLLNNRNLYVYSIEPNKEICEPSLLDLAHKYPNNFFYVPAALSLYDGEAKLYSSKILNGQIASTLKPNIEGSWSKIIKDQVKEFPENEHVKVKALSVQKFIQEHDLTKIDFLKIDIQGVDVDILEKFLELSEVSVAVMEVEVDGSMKMKHYLNSSNTFHELFDVLKTHGYRIIKIFPATGDCNEYNVFISKSKEIYDAVDNLLDFANIPIFSRFWKVLGIGHKENQELSNLHKNFVRKLITSIKHPIKSYKSVLMKITS